MPWARSTTLLERVSDAAEALVALGATRVQTVDGVESVLALGRARDDGPFALAYAVDGRLVTTFPVGSAESVLAWIFCFSSSTVSAGSTCRNSVVFRRLTRTYIDMPRLEDGAAHQP